MAPQAYLGAVVKGSVVKKKKVKRCQLKGVWHASAAAVTARLSQKTVIGCGKTTRSDNDNEVLTARAEGVMIQPSVKVTSSTNTARRSRSLNSGVYAQSRG